MSTEASVAAIKATMARYIELFNAFDFATAVNSYQMPFSWIVGQTISTANTPEEFVAFMTSMRTNLADQGLDHSELISCTVRMLGPDAALTGVVVGRHYKGDRPMEPTCATYITHYDGQDWKFTSLVGHPADAIIPGSA